MNSHLPFTIKKDLKNKMMKYAQEHLRLVFVLILKITW